MQVRKLLEPWATNRWQEISLEALQTYGEKVVLRRVWQLSDLKDGKTTRCLECQAGATDSVKARLADLYKQGGESWCENCYGTGFDGGFEDVIYVVWALISGSDMDWKLTPKGEYVERKPNVQLAWIPSIENRDLIVRVREWEDEVTPSLEHARLVIDSGVEKVRLKTGPVISDSSIYVAQKANLTQLPPDHPLAMVPIREGAPVPVEPGRGSS